MTVNQKTIIFHLNIITSQFSTDKEGMTLARLNWATSHVIRSRFSFKYRNKKYKSTSAKLHKFLKECIISYFPTENIVNRCRIAIQHGLIYQRYILSFSTMNMHSQTCVIKNHYTWQSLPRVHLLISTMGSIVIQKL